ENWNTFEDALNNVFNAQSTPLSNMNRNEINKTWNYWSAKTKEIMNKHIPYTYTAPKPFFTLSLKATKLYSALKHINKCLYYLTGNFSSNLTDANHHLSRAAILAEIDIPLITQ